MKKVDSNIDDFMFEDRSDDFESFDEEDKLKTVVKKKKPSEEFDISVDDEQEPILEDLEEFDENGDPCELDFDR
jgi:hypothetical protein